ncbi:MAG: hypothetical protein ACLUQ6_09385 [Alistipes onderdonkii]
MHDLDGHRVLRRRPPSTPRAAVAIGSCISACSRPSAFRCDARGLSMAVVAGDTFMRQILSPSAIWKRQWIARR